GRGDLRRQRPTSARRRDAERRDELRDGSVLRQLGDPVDAHCHHGRPGGPPRPAASRTRAPARSTLVEAEAAVRMRVRGLTLVGVASIAALALVGLGLRSFGVAESNGPASPGAEIFAVVIGVWLPLFALIYAYLRNRLAFVSMAFCM